MSVESRSNNTVGENGDQCATHDSEGPMTISVSDSRSLTGGRGEGSTRVPKRFGLRYQRKRKWRTGNNARYPRLEDSDRPRYRMGGDRYVPWRARRDNRAAACSFRRVVPVVLGSLGLRS